MKSLFLFVLFLHCAGSMPAGDIISPSEFHAEIVKTYDFRAHTMAQNELDARFSELDRFWDKVNKEKEACLPLLRTELQAMGNPAYFYFDGSGLLLTLSEDLADKKIALRALPKADLADVRQGLYLTTVHELATLELDTSEAAMRILDYPDFKADIPMHALELDQFDSLPFLLIPTKEEFYIDKLIARLPCEKSELAQQSIIMMLWLTGTKKGDEAIRNFCADSRKPAASQNKAKELLDKKFKTEPGINPSVDAYTALKQKRRTAMNRISDEAIIEFGRLTKEMLANRTD